MRKILLSGFADEAGVMVEEQMDVFEKNGIYSIEMRNVNGKHILECTQEELDELDQKLKSRGFTISAIGSPIGKSDIRGDFDLVKKQFDKAVEVANKFECKYIRAFSFYTPKDEDPNLYSEEVVKRINELVSIARENDIIYGLENEVGIFGDTIERCLYILEKIDSENIKLILDPGNFVKAGVRPYPDAYESLKKHLGYFHIKDAKSGDEHFAPSGEGDSEMDKLITAAYKDGFDNYLSIEPHLGYLSHLNKAQQFTVACNALKKTLNKALGTSFVLTDLEEFNS